MGGFELELNDPDWFREALCRDNEREVFQRLVQIDYNGIINGNPEGRREYYELRDIGKAICACCPVVNQCAEYGLEHRLPGMYGGMTQREQRNERRKLWRSNPKNH